MKSDAFYTGNRSNVIIDTYSVIMSYFIKSKQDKKKKLGQIGHPFLDINFKRYFDQTYSEHTSRYGSTMFKELVAKTATTRKIVQL